MHAALETCVNRWLDPVLEMAVADVIVVIWCSHCAVQWPSLVGLNSLQYTSWVAHLPYCAAPPRVFG